MCPFRGGSRVHIYHNVARAKAYLRAKFHLDPSNRLATIHQRYRQTDRQDLTGQDRTGSQTDDRQRSDSIGRTVLQTVARKWLKRGDAVCVMDSGWPKEACGRWGPDPACERAIFRRPTTVTL